MIMTYLDKDHVVQAMRLTGTESSARSLCRWLEMSLWNLAPLGDGTYKVTIPGMYSERNETQTVVKDCWVVRDKKSNVTIMTDTEFKSRYERI